MTTSVDLGLAADTLEYTNFASGGWKLNTVGLKSGTLQVNFNQDFAASQVDALFGLGGTFGFGTGTVFYMDIKPTSAARGATNPSYLLALLNTRGGTWEKLFRTEPGPVAARIVQAVEQEEGHVGPDGVVRGPGT